MSSDQGKRIHQQFDPNYLLVLLLTVFALAPLTYPGFFQAESGFLPVFNAGHLAEAPHWGRPIDPVRGEGKLPYLIAWPFYQLTGSGTAAIKWGYGLAFVIGALGLYAWTRRRLGTRGAVLAAAVYTYLPWHLSTVYIRGAYGEAWLWAFWPLILWAIDRFNGGQPQGILVGIAVGIPALVALLWSQPGLALLSLPILVGYAFTVNRSRPLSVTRLVGTLFLILLALWFAASLAPAADPGFADQLLHPYQLLSAAWGDGPSFQLGLAAAGLTIVAVALWTYKHPESHISSHAFWFWFVVLILLVILALQPLAFLWRLTGFDALLTNPWQVLALTGLPLAFLSGSVLCLDRRLATLPAWAGLVSLVLLASYPYLVPDQTQVDPGPRPVAFLQPVEADAPQILLLDYDIEPPTEISPTLGLTLTWQAVQPVASDYTVFAHLLADGDAKAAQRDTRPCDGACPTDSWQPGQIVVDHHELTLNTGAPPGPYRLALGLYLLETGDRATVAGQDEGTVYLDVP
jgi:hypothetical protein